MFGKLSTEGLSSTTVGVEGSRSDATSAVESQGELMSLLDSGPNVEKLSFAWRRPFRWKYSCHLCDKRGELIIESDGVGFRFPVEGTPSETWAWFFFMDTYFPSVCEGPSVGEAPDSPLLGNVGGNVAGRESPSSLFRGESLCCA